MGVKLCDVYRKVYDYIKDKISGMVENVYMNFGFGIGTGYKEDNLLINADN